MTEGLEDTIIKTFIPHSHQGPENIQTHESAAFQVFTLNESQYNNELQILRVKL